MYKILNKPEILWAFGKKIYIKNDVITNEMCDEIIAYGQNNVIKGFNKYPGSFDISFHTCLLPMNHMIHISLQKIWEEAATFLNIDINFVEPYELKRYTKDDFFSKHSDNYFSLENGLDRKLTLSVQLSNTEDYVGGEFGVISKKYKLKRGSVICIPSYFPHEVSKIIDGTRWALIGWAWGNNWR